MKTEAKQRNHLLLCFCNGYKMKHQSLLPSEEWAPPSSLYHCGDVAFFLDMVTK